LDPENLPPGSPKKLDFTLMKLQGGPKSPNQSGVGDTMIASVALDPCLLGLGRFSDGVGVASRDLDQVSYRLARSLGRWKGVPRADVAEKANWLGAKPSSLYSTALELREEREVQGWIGLAACLHFIDREGHDWCDWRWIREGYSLADHNHQGRTNLTAKSVGSTFAGLIHHDDG